MGRLIRILFSMILSAFAARVIEGMMAPKSKDPLQPQTTQKPLPTLDLKPCPKCGTYTTQPCPHCQGQSA